MVFVLPDVARPLTAGQEYVLDAENLCVRYAKSQFQTPQLENYCCAQSIDQKFMKKDEDYKGRCS
jgi:hypothetical protein